MWALLERTGILAVTIELAESFVVNERNVDVGVRSVFNILSDLEVVADLQPFRYALPDGVCGDALLT